MITRYTCSKDQTANFITLAIFILFIAEGVMLTTILFSKMGDEVSMVFRVCIVLLPWLILSGAYLYSVTGISLDDKSLYIERPIGAKKILIHDILEANPIDKKELKGTIRGFGNGGIFGYYGKFFNSKFGSMTWYVTRRDRLIMLKLRNSKLILISPDDSSLVDLINKPNPSS